MCEFCSYIAFRKCVIFITGMHYCMIWLTVQKLWHMRSIIVLEVSQLELCLSQAELCDSRWIMHVMKKSVLLALLWVYGMHLWCVSFRRQDKHPICVPSSMTSRRIRLSRSWSCKWRKREREYCEKHENNLDHFISCKTGTLRLIHPHRNVVSAEKGWFTELHSSNITNFCCRIQGFLHYMF